MQHTAVSASSMVPLPAPLQQPIDLVAANPTTVAVAVAESDAMKLEQLEQLVAMIREEVEKTRELMASMFGIIVAKEVTALPLTLRRRRQNTESETPVVKTKPTEEIKNRAKPWNKRKYE